ncbi:MAG: glycosyltransferase [Planctomycetota bacterium]
MRVLHLCDELFFLRESSLLRRLRVGLVDEGIRLATAVPERVGERTEDLLSGPIVTYGRDRLALGRGLRQRRLVDQICQSAGWDEGPDVIHCFGGGSWALGEQLARQESAVLVLELWRRGLSHRVRAIRGLQSRGEGDGPVLLAPWKSIEAEAKEDLRSLTIRHNPWGVHTSPKVAARAEAGKTRSVILAGGRHSATRLLKAFRGCAELIEKGMDLIVFADALGTSSAGLWKLATKLGLTDRLSVIADLEVDRTLPLAADALVYAGNPGEVRTLLLDAMATGLPVVAGEDPWNEALLDRRTAFLVPEPERDGWREPLETALEDKPLREEICRSAAEWVKKNNRTSACVATLLDVYETAAAEATGTTARIGAS